MPLRAVVVRNVPMRHVPDEERRSRLAVRHHLAPPAQVPDVAAVAGDLVGLHATDPASVFLGARARTGGLAADAVERALYDDRTVFRMLAMRRTMFVVPVTLVALLQHASSDAVAATEVKRLAKQLEVDEVTGDGVAWIERVGDLTVAALEAAGEASANELTAAVPELQTKIHLAPGKSYGGWVNVTSRILTVLGAQGRVARGRSSGAWNTTRYRWAPAAAWLGRPAPEPIAVAEARAELVRRWLLAFGPGTEADLKWWTGWNLGDTRRAIAANDVVEVGLHGGGTGLLLADDVEPIPEPEPWVALLPALDPTPMGWKVRDWYLGAHGAALFDTMGNVGPTIWSDGRIVGGWTQRKDGTVATRLLERVSKAKVAAIAEEARALEGWIGDVRITWRFPTPLQRDLAG